MTALLPEHFLAQARRTPAAPAVVSDDGDLTYGELELSSLRIANALKDMGVGRECAVGVLVSPGPHMVAALLGIWLAGGCYVPLDPVAPESRQRDVVALAGLSGILADDPQAVPDLGVPVHDVARLAASGSSAAPGHVTDPRQAAYMMFTSGSTGVPKGVVIEHAGIANRVGWGVSALGLTAADRVLQKTPMTFDAAGWEVFAPLVCGAPVTFGRPDAGRDALELIESIKARQATVLQVVPTMLQLLVAEPSFGTCSSLRLICCGGEPLYAELCQRVLDRLDVRIQNSYGPTECSIDVTAAWFDPVQRSGPVPIGHPIDNTRCLLVPVGDGGIQELYVSGVGVARGYHGSAAHTADRFVPDASAGPGARLYRTGDLVRRLPDGALEFAGRSDAQVKVNGIRIEPGEIEVAIEAHPDVVAAAVQAVTDPNGIRRLAAWIVTTRENVALDAHLRDRLPPPLIPAIVTELAELPRTTSGKTDRARLPDVDWTVSTGHAGRLTPEQGIVLAAWRKLLGVEEVGLDDNFFRVGGHSLMTIRLAAGLAEASGLALDFHDLHYATTAREQAELLGKAARAQRIDRLPTGARRPLSHAQERFWVLDRINPGSREYLLPVFIWLPAAVPADVVEPALAVVMERHEVLRTGYVMDDEGLAAVVHPTAGVPLRTVDTSPAEMGKVVTSELSEGFDLTTAPVWRACLIRDSGKDQLLLLVCHHIVCDGWSGRLLGQEVREAVAAIQEDRPPRLPDLPVGYTDAVAWQRAQLTEQLLADQLDYWRATLAGLPPLELPAVRDRDAERQIDGAAVGFGLSGEISQELVAIGRRVGATPHVVFMTLWTILLARAGGQWDFGVGSPHAGRSRPELHGLVGLFINVVVIRARLTPDVSFADALVQVEHACREGFARSAAPFEAVADALALPRDPSRTPVFQTLFTMAGDDLAGQRFQQRDLELLGQAVSVARTDMALTVWPYPDGRYGGAIEYASALFDESTATDMAGQLCELAARFAADPNLPVGAGIMLSPHQETILGFARDLLDRQDIGLDDDIMGAGGTSLKVARLLWRVSSTFGVEVSMRAFFDHPTAGDLAGEVERLIRAELETAQVN